MALTYTPGMKVVTTTEFPVYNVSGELVTVPAGAFGVVTGMGRDGAVVRFIGGGRVSPATCTEVLDNEIELI